MKKAMWILIIIIIIAIMVLLAMGFYYFTMQSKVKNIKTFSEILGFSFQYPEFKGWEVNYEEKVSDNEFVVYFNNPDTIAFEYPPSMRIIKNSFLYGGPNGSKTEDNPNIKTTQNNVKYYTSYDNAIGSRDGLPYINFYANDSIVVVYPFLHEGDGYSGKVMIEKIIDTFQFTCSAEKFRAVLLKELVSQNYLYSANYSKALIAEGAQAVVKKLQENKENQDNFYATVKPDEKQNENGVFIIETITYNLYHKDDFKLENCNENGNPSGKSRTMIYNVKRGEIISDLLRQ